MEKLAILAGLLVLAVLLMVNGLWWLALVCGFCTLTLAPRTMHATAGFVGLLGITILALVYGVWFGAMVGGLAAISLLPIVKGEIGSLLEHTRFEGMVPSPLWPFPRSQQLAVGGLIFPPFIVWRFIEGGWTATVVSVLSFVGILVWFVFVMRSEGWSGEKAREKESVDSLK